MKFTTETFDGREGRISPILREFVPNALAHWHLAVYQSNTALGYWAGHAIRSSGKPVIQFGFSGSYSRLLPESELPDEAVEERPYALTKRGLLARLDRLPLKYDPSDAGTGGLGISEEFIAPYENLRSEIGAVIRDNFSDCYGASIRRLYDPSIMKGAQLSVFPGNFVYKQVLFYAMKNLGIWDSSFENLWYHEPSNLVSGIGPHLDKDSVIAAMEEFGGWIDFAPKRPIEAGKYWPNVACNLTVTGKDEKGLKAIVSKAYIIPTITGTNVSHLQLPPTDEQERFMSSVYEAFGVESS